jgi:hypothetical protein
VSPYRTPLALRSAAIFRLCALMLGALLVLSACSSAPSTPGTSSARATPSQRAAATPDAATACAPNVGAAATAYPGWPGSGQAIAPNADTIPVLASNDLAVGPNRFLLTVIDSKNNSIASPGVHLSLDFYNLAANPNAPVVSANGIFYDNGAGKGLYRASVNFPCWGDWGVAVKVARPSKTDTARVIFDVQATSSTPGIGEAAPPADTPTATDAAGMAAISTDQTPDPAFYRMTITQAETNGKPSLIIFATPAFCQTATCGPTLDRVGAIAQPYEGQINFVHVEPYQLKQTPTGLQPVLDARNQLQPVAAANTFGLLSEPYTFILDAQGRVTAKFDGIMGQDELTAALDAVSGVTPAASAPAAATPAASAPAAATPAASGAPASGAPASP